MSSGSISSPTFEEDFTLDQLGNWQNLVKKTGGSTTLDHTRAHNEVNETGTITTTTGTPWEDPVHDDAGNMTTMPQPKSPGDGYTAIYDAWNRMVEVKDGGTTIQSNQYDGLHRRIVRDETGGSGTVRHFYYNENWQCVEERDGSYNFVKRHFWHPYYIDALAASIDSTGERVSFVHDANFNVTMAVDDTYNAATVIERYHYSPYGEVTYLNPDFSVKGTQVSAVGNEYLYTGRRLDPGTGLYYYRYRYYHAQLGRFTTQDPIGYQVRRYNLYSYVDAKPLNRLDPSGLEDEDCNKLCNANTVGHRRGTSLQVSFSGGNQNPDRGNNAINLLIILLGFNEAVLNGPIDHMVDQLPNLINGEPGSDGLTSVHKLAELKLLQDFWARANGQRYSVWIK